MATPARTLRVGRFVCHEGVHPKSIARLREIHGYFTEDILRGTVVPIVTQRSAVSLRALDWLVTNYSKKHHIVVRHSREDGSECVTNVHADYKSWLKNFRRRNFDPFRRRQRIEFGLDDAVQCTTVGQLNFIYWACHHGVIQYARDNIEGIERDMTVCMQTMRGERTDAQSRGVKRKRRELSTRPTNQCFVYRLPLKCTFGSHRQPRPGSSAIGESEHESDEEQHIR